MKAIIHVNQHIIRANKKNGTIFGETYMLDCGYATPPEYLEVVDDE